MSTTPAEVDFSLHTTPARLRHPIRSAKASKTFPSAPIPIEVASPNIFKMQIGNGRRSSRAGEHVADWIDGEITPAPAVETRFWPGLIIIGEYIENLHSPGKQSFCCDRHFSRTSNLVVSGQQRCAIKESPSIELHIRQLDSLGFERFSELNHLRQTIDVAPVNHKIEAQRNFCRANFGGDIQFALMREGSGDFVG